MQDVENSVIGQSIKTRFIVKFSPFGLHSPFISQKSVDLFVQSYILIRVTAGISILLVFLDGATWPNLC